MSKKKKDKKDKTKSPKKSNLDIDQLKEFGIIKELSKDIIEEVDKIEIMGGRRDTTTVDTQWPTTTPGA